MSEPKRRDESLATISASAPLVRATLWLSAVAAIATISVFLFADMDLVRRHLKTPYAWLELGAIALTACAAILAAFCLNTSRTSPRWVFLPVPPLTLWLIVCAYDCLRHVTLVGAEAWDLGDSPHCVLFILAISIPLGISVMATYRLRPGRSSALAGLGVATFAICLLQFFHPFDSNLTDLIAHITAAAIVVGAMTYSAQLMPTIRI